MSLTAMPVTPAVPSTTSPPPTSVPSALLASGLYRLSVRQYDRMVQDGTIHEDARVELIEGLLVTKMGKKRPHVQAGKKGLKAFEQIIPRGWHVAKEDPIVASDWSKPEPDLAIVRGEVEEFDERDVVAADVALVVEIAESSLSVDRVDMARVYAAGGIPVYWIVNLVDRQVEVYTSPGAEGCQSRQDFLAGQEVPVVIDGVERGRIAVSELLP
jgi:Uma2 family endonuclease